MLRSSKNSSRSQSDAVGVAHQQSAPSSDRSPPSSSYKQTKSEEEKKESRPDSASSLSSNDSFTSAQAGNLLGDPKIRKKSTPSSHSGESRLLSASAQTLPKPKIFNLKEKFNESTIIGKLRTQGIGNRFISKVTPEQKNDSLRASRSLASSIEQQHADPSLAMPRKNYINDRDRDSSDAQEILMQRPGPETRRNEVNISEEAKAMQKHGHYRKLRLGATDAEKLINMLSSKLEISRDVASDLVKNSKWSGGYPHPARTDIGRANAAENRRREVFWNARSTVQYIAKGLRGFGDPFYNPKGKTIEHTSPTGQGIRTSDLSVDHVHLSASLSGHDINTGPNLRTHRGMTNPPYFTKAAFEAEEKRFAEDLRRNPKTPRPEILELMDKYDMKNRL